MGAAGINELARSHNPVQVVDMYGETLKQLAGTGKTSLAKGETVVRRSRFEKCVEHLAEEVNHNNVHLCGCGYTANRDNAKRLAKTWLRDCQRAGILPPTWWPVFLLIRAWLMPLLIDLAMKWLVYLAAGSTVTITGAMSEEATNC